MVYKVIKKGRSVIIGDGTIIKVSFKGHMLEKKPGDTFEMLEGMRLEVEGIDPWKGQTVNFLEEEKKVKYAVNDNIS